MWNADTFILNVVPGKTYLLRIINAALNDEMFLAIANHTMAVVEVDAVYTKPVTTDTIMIAPGQTTNVLLTASASDYKDKQFFIAATPYATGQGTFYNTTPAAILSYYKHVHFNTSHLNSSSNFSNIILPKLPVFNDTAFATNFTLKIKSLASAQYPALVP